MSSCGVMCLALMTINAQWHNGMGREGAENTSLNMPMLGNASPVSRLLARDGGETRKPEQIRHLAGDAKHVTY